MLGKPCEATRSNPAFFLIFLVEFFCKKDRQFKEVLYSLAQRGYFDRKCVQAIEQIRSKIACFNHLMKFAIGSRYNLAIDTYRGSSPQSVYGMGVQSGQYFGLDV